MNEEEIKLLLQFTSEKSIAAIVRYMEKLADAIRHAGDGMHHSDRKVFIKESMDFMKDMSVFKTPRL